MQGRKVTQNNHLDPRSPPNTIEFGKFSLRRTGVLFSFESENSCGLDEFESVHPVVESEAIFMLAASRRTCLNI
jgi:hypothetical protein